MTRRRTGDQRQSFLPVRRGGDRPVAGAPARRVTLPVFLPEDGLVTDAQVRRLREKRMAGKTRWRWRPGRSMNGEERTTMAQT